MTESEVIGVLLHPVLQPAPSGKVNTFSPGSRIKTIAACGPGGPAGVLRTAMLPRTSFNYGGTINWFPGHMAKAAADLQQRVRTADVVIEVRDSRVGHWTSVLACNPFR